MARARIPNMAKDPLEILRRLCLALPEVTERLSHGEPTWFVRGKKTFVMYANHHHDDRLGFWCAAPDGAQEALVGSAPDQFFIPPTSDIAAGSACVWTWRSIGTRSPISSRMPTARSLPPSWWPSWTLPSGRRQCSKEEGT